MQYLWPLPPYHVVLSQATEVTEVAVLETVPMTNIGWILSSVGSLLQCSKKKKKMTVTQKTCVHDIASSRLQRKN